MLVFYGDKVQRKKLVDEDLKQGQFEVIITTYECAMKEKHSLNKIVYEYIIVDEAHRIKNKDSKLSADLRVLRARHKLLITGTPLQNNLSELWSLLNFLMPKVSKIYFFKRINILFFVYLIALIHLYIFRFSIAMRTLTRFLTSMT